MKQKEAIGKQSEGQPKGRLNKWRGKAIFRRKENEKLRKRIKELERSRSRWKEKHKLLQERIEVGAKLSTQKAARHQYSLSIIVLMELYKYGGMSLRSCRHSLCYVFVYEGLSTRLPSPSSIRN